MDQLVESLPMQPQEAECTYRDPLLPTSTELVVEASETTPVGLAPRCDEADEGNMPDTENVRTLLSDGFPLPHVNN